MKKIILLAVLMLCFAAIGIVVGKLFLLFVLLFFVGSIFIGYAAGSKIRESFGVFSFVIGVVITFLGCLFTVATHNGSVYMAGNPAFLFGSVMSYILLFAGGGVIGFSIKIMQYPDKEA